MAIFSFSVTLNNPEDLAGTCETVKIAPHASNSSASAACKDRVAALDQNATTLENWKKMKLENGNAWFLMLFKLMQLRVFKLANFDHQFWSDSDFNEEIVSTIAILI